METIQSRTTRSVQFIRRLILSSNAVLKLYFSDQVNETVFEINTAIGATTYSNFVGSNPRGFAVDPSGVHVVVADFASAGVCIINTATQAVTDVDFGSLSGVANPSPNGFCA